jgi:multiple sugar transport system substrate-binding protein
MRKSSVALLAFAGAALLLLSVGGAQARPGRLAQTTVTLSGWSSGTAEDTLLQAVVAKFEATHPSIKVDYSVINGDYPTAMTARFAAHNPPDVFYVDSSLASTWAAQGVLEPLNSFVKSSGFDTSKFFPNLLNTFTVGGKIYGFPKDWSPLAMEANTGMLGAAHQHAPRTWGQLTSVAKAIAGANVLLGGGKPICLSPDWARMLAFVYQSGGSLSNVTSPAVVRAVNFYVGLLKSGLAATPTQLGVGWCGDALGQGKSAIIFEGNWLIPSMTMTYPKTRYGIFPMVHSLHKGNLAFTVSYSMAADSPNKQAAWTLLSWLTGQAGQKQWISEGLALPSRSDVPAIGGRGAFLGAASSAHGWGFPNFSNTYTVMNNDLDAVISGSMTVSNMLTDIQNALKGA